MAERIRELIETTSSNLNNRQEVVPTPENYKSYNLPQLRDSGYMKALMDAYREVFGSDEKVRRTDETLWGEAVKCPMDGWSRVFPWSAVNDMEQSEDGSRLCSHCNKPVTLCYPDSLLEVRLEEEVENGGVVTVMLNDSGTEVEGFSWGKVVEPAEFVESFVRARFQGSEEKGRELLTPVLEQITEPVFYWPEFAIRERSRGGFNPVRFLSIPGFENGLGQDVKNAIYWTRRGSPIYPITIMFGFEEVFQAERYSIMHIEDFRPTLDMLKKMKEEGDKKVNELSDFMLQASKIAMRRS